MKRGTILLLALLALFSYKTEAKTKSNCSVNNETHQITSFNMRYDNSDDGINRWDNRKAWIVDYITFNELDIIGTQELLHHQLDYLNTNMPNYNYIGVGRDDGKTKGEYAAILYNKERYTVEDSGTFWLAEDSTKPGILGWDAVCPRVVTWGVFNDRSNNTFLVLNTHFDHRGQEARRESVAFVMDMKEKYEKKMPVILMGDFNANYESVPYKLLTKESSSNAHPFYDTKFIAKRTYGVNWTFNGFGHEGIEVDGGVIDHILVSDTKRLSIEKHLTSEEEILGKYISDHYPVTITVKLKPTK